MEKNGGARPSVAPPFEFLWISSTDETSLSYHQFLVHSALVVVLSQICNVLVTFEKVRKQTYLYGVLSMSVILPPCTVESWNLETVLKI